jgi:FtsP/CotA-like multicopper oxidase with cupredoxin domain
MLSRRDILLGSGCALATFSAPAHADPAPDGFTVLRASTAGFDGAVPGPVIRARRGEEVKVRLVNGLDEPTALHWHGVRLPNAMDSGSPLTGPPVAPGASFDYRFTVPDAGTFWYRAMRRDQQERGLYGALVVEEQATPPVDRDELLLFADRRDGDGTRQFTLNGAAAVDIPARPNERLRLRFINASATQAMNARIDRHRVFVMALDGEPAEPFVSRDSGVSLGPGNRADVFVDAALPSGSIAPIAFMQGGGEAVLARIVYGGSPARAASPGEPAPLPANPLPERMNFSGALRITLPIDPLPTLPRPLPNPPPQAGEGRVGGRGRVGRGSLDHVPLFTAARGRTVVMALDNRDAVAHVVHLHGHHFRLLDRLDDGWKPYWLDTIAVAGKQTVRIAFVADNPGRWPIEQHALDGPAAEVNWFEVKSEPEGRR